MFSGSDFIMFIPIRYSVIKLKFKIVYLQRMENNRGEDGGLLGGWMSEESSWRCINILQLSLMIFLFNKF